ncbi:MAG: hypothetical protein Q9217_003412 [Psora testacea]
MLLGLALISSSWIAGVVLGLMEATRSLFCEDNRANRFAWRGMTNCKIQKIAVAIAALSMWEIPHRDRYKTLIDLSGWTPIATPSEKISNRHSYDYMSPYTPPSPPGPVHTPCCPPCTSWLPPLKFQDSPEEDHPALKAEPKTPAQSSITVDLLPSPTNGFPLIVDRSICQQSLTRNQTAGTTSSSLYSRATSASSTFSRNPSTLSSFSDSSLGSASKCSPLSTMSSTGKPDVPKIPHRFRQSNHMLRGGGRPIRPGSTPTMPPSAFWLYARNAQQKRNALMDAETQETPRNLQSRIPSRSSRKREASVCRYPIMQASLEQAASPPGPSTDRHHTVRVAKRGSGSYEKLRKGQRPRPPNWAGKADLDRRLATAAREAVFNETGAEPRRRPSRTLVKKRQPWDARPRSMAGIRHAY